jgi:cytochrome d ubiquinol oxidase subunit I
MTVAAVSALAQPLVGPWAAEVVAETQPVKLAAMEGQWRTESRAPLRIGGWPDERTGTTPYAIEVPGMLSWMAYGDMDATVRGLAEVPPDDRPPVVWVHLAFQVMVACGVAMAVLGAWFGLAAWRAGGVPRSRGLLWTIVACAPLGFVAIEAGWIVTEVGRQPWIIAGVMRTEEAVTPMPGLWVPMMTFTAVYLALAGVVAVVLIRQVRGAGPEGRADGH